MKFGKLASTRNTDPVNTNSVRASEKNTTRKSKAEKLAAATAAPTISLRASLSDAIAGA
jgi:hypothetical protein